MATKLPSQNYGIELLIAYYQNPTIKLRNKLVQMNAGLVRKIAHRMSHQSPESYEDLEQIGYIGLIRAIERFNPYQGHAFSSFAVPCIRGEILHFLRDRTSTLKVPRRWQDLYRQGQKFREEYTNQKGRSPSDAEIASALGVSVNEWQEIKLSTKNRSLLSLDATIAQYVDSPVTLGETLPDAREQTLQTWEEDRQQIQKALSQLEDTTRAAIEFVYYSNLSRKEAADRIGVSPMTVTRRIHQGLRQMMVILQPQIAQ